MTGITRRPLINKFNVAIHDVTSGGMSAKDAVGKAYKRIDDIFAKYQIKA